MNRGMFVVPLEFLKEATKGIPVDIVAVDRQEKQESKKFLVSSGEASLPIDRAISTIDRVGGYHALVIGGFMFCRKVDSFRYGAFQPRCRGISDITSHRARKFELI
jgi:hypothetical protein